ncbi:MAG: AhpC/TSA family protein [Chitinophagaceae bacterium]|nr:AhpC/TSA family protein [Chitinophagaceae bacterium]
MKKITGLFSFLLILSSIAFAQPETAYPEGLKVGEIAPDFSAKDQDGNIINLKQALQKGPVVMLFYRGQWCPYCNKQMSRFSDSLSLLIAKGASVLAIAPETAENVKKTIEKTKSTFPVLEDQGLAIMKMYKVNFAVDEKTITKYKGYGIDFDEANGVNGANLPVPATYIIGKDGKVKYVFFNTDYRKRASVMDVLNNL